MKKEILNKLLSISESERSVMADNYNLISHAEPAFANMKLRRRDYLWNVIDSAQSVSARPHTRFVDIPLHSHNYTEMMYILSGSVTHIIDGQSYVLNEGDLLIMNRHVMHSIPSSGRDDVAVNFIISHGFLSSSSHRIKGEPSLRELIDEGKEENGLPVFLIYKTSLNPATENLMENLIIDTLLAPSMTDVTRQSILKDTLFLLFKYFEMCPEALIHGTAEQNESDPLKRKKGSYIQNNYKRASLSELSEMLDFSQPYLSRRVKELFGASFTELVKDRRFSEAEQLLANTDLPITDIAESVGYENNSFFHRRFREQYGTSPSKWRKGR